MENVNASKIDVQKFGVMFSGITLAIAVIRAYRNDLPEWTWLLGGFVLLLASGIWYERRALRFLGIPAGVICAVLGALSVVEWGLFHSIIFPLSFFFLVTGLFARRVLQPVYVLWMKFAVVLAWINTRIILGLFFYLIVTPIGLLMRLFGKDLLDERLDPRAQSYWIKREKVPFDPRRVENQF